MICMCCNARTAAKIFAILQIIFACIGCLASVGLQTWVFIYLNGNTFDNNDIIIYIYATLVLTLLFYGSIISIAGCPIVCTKRRFLKKKKDFTRPSSYTDDRTTS